MTQRKLLLINGLYSNGNIEGKDIADKERELERNFDQAIKIMYGGVKKEEPKLEDNPFFAPAERARRSRALKLSDEEKEADSLNDLTDTQFEVDQG